MLFYQIRTTMEKVKVKSSTIKKQGEKNGKKWTIYEVTLEDGRKGDCFDEMVAGQEYEIEIKANSNPQYNPSFALVKEQKKGFAPRDYTFDKKRVALECAVSMTVNKAIPLEKLAETRDKFFAYLNEK